MSNRGKRAGNFEYSLIPVCNCRFIRLARKSEKRKCKSFKFVKEKSKSFWRGKKRDCRVRGNYQLIISWSGKGGGQLPSLVSHVGCILLLLLFLLSKKVAHQQERGELRKKLIKSVQGW
jgi:hypothetical protein